MLLGRVSRNHERLTMREIIRDLCFISGVFGCVWIFGERVLMTSETFTGGLLLSSYVHLRLEAVRAKRNAALPLKANRKRTRAKKARDEHEEFLGIG